MDEMERPEKRRKLHGNKDNGSHSPRSPRVLLNKINVDNALLQRFRQIKTLAQQKLNSKIERKESRNEGSEFGKDGNPLPTDKESDDSCNPNIIRKDLVQDGENTNQPRTEVRKDDKTLFLSNKFNDETVEVLDSSEKWMQNERSAKRKRDENCNENASVENVANYFEDDIVSIDETQKTEQFSSKADENTPSQSSISEEVKGNTKSLSDQREDVFTADDTKGNPHENVVEVAKVAQDYAKSGAQTEKAKEDEPEKIEKCYLHGEKYDFENTDESEDYAEEASVYQLLKEVVEKQTTSYANNLMLENAKLEKRVEHLEKENALLQKTSKRLHLALQAVFKNREKARQPGSSRAVQVNMDLQRPCFRHTSRVNIDIAEEAQVQNKAVDLLGEEPDKTPSEGFVDKVASKQASNDASNLPNSDNKDCPSVCGREAGTRKVIMKTIGLQTQENLPPKYFTEGMGHFKLQSCSKHRAQPTIIESGEQSHYKMTPRGLELKTKWRASTESHEDDPPTTSAETDCTQTKDSSNSPSRGTSIFTPVDQNIKRTDEGNTTSPFPDTTRRTTYASYVNTDVTVVPIAQHSSTSPLKGKETSRSYSLAPQSSQNISLAKSQFGGDGSPRSHTWHRPQNSSLAATPVGEDEILRNTSMSHSSQNKSSIPKDANGSNYRESHSPVIPKNTIDPSIKSMNSPKAQSPKNCEEPDLIIVSPKESSITRDGSRNARPKDVPSLRTVQAEISSKTNDREMAERQRHVYYSPTSRIQERNQVILERNEAEKTVSRRIPNAQEQKQVLSGRNMTENLVTKTALSTQEQSQILSGRSVSENTVSKTMQNTVNNRTLNPQEIRQSTVAHLNQIQSQQAVQYTNAAIRIQERSSQLNIRQEASGPPRNAALEMRAVVQNKSRDNAHVHGGSPHPPQLIPSQPQRTQEQLRSTRSASLEIADSQRKQGHPISTIPEGQNRTHLQRVPVAAQHLRLQKPPPAPSHLSPQQHLIIRQQHSQQMVPPPYQPPRAGNPQGYTQQHPRISQPNAVRSHAPPPFQSAHNLQQVPRPMVGPARSHQNMPLSPEYGRTFIQRAPPCNQATSSQSPHLIPGSVQQTRPEPVVVYQPGALEGAARQSIPSTQAHFERFPEHKRQGQNPPQGQAGQQRLANTAEQSPTIVQNQMAQRPPPYETQRVEDRRQRPVAGRPRQVRVSQAGSQRSPPKPSASIAVVENGIVLSWNVSPEQDTSDIDSYELFACQDDSSSSCPPVLWKKIGVVKALPLPMACTLTQFSTGSRYQFAVRAVDTSERAGPFSDPCVITLKKP